MFGEGHAAIPKNGIEAIPKQILQNLTKSEIKLKTKVTSIKNDEITLLNSTKLKSDYIIIATDVNN